MLPQGLDTTLVAFIAACTAFLTVVTPLLARIAAHAWPTPVPSAQRVELSDQTQTLKRIEDEQRRQGEVQKDQGTQLEHLHACMEATKLRVDEVTRPPG